MQATCPHCQTVFKVSDENLKIADGFVRCGICKEVFNALKKSPLENKKEAAAPAKTVPSPTTPAKKVAAPKDADPVEFILEKSNEVSTAKKPASNSATNKPSGQNTKTSKPTNQGNLFKTPPPKHITTIIEATQANTRKTEQTKPKAKNVTTPANKTNNSSNKISERTNKATPVVFTKAAPDTTTPHTTKIKNTQGQQTKATDSNLFDGVQSKLIPDEYRIPELHNTYSIWKDLAWSMAILVLTASLFVEYTWFNRNELIRNPQLRPLITQFCTLTNCGNMDLREPGEIEMTTRNIYTHPNVKNALMISGTLINHASFEQPYPNILIDFSNVRGEVTASRIFTPEDYLQIKLSSLKPLAPNVSVDFTMEIKDPGKNAMTYEFSFL